MAGCSCPPSTLGGCMSCIETNWEMTRTTGMVRKAAVSSQPRVGTPSTQFFKIQSEPWAGSAPYVGPSRNLDDTGDAAGEGVHLIGLVHLGNLLVHDLRIRLILGLNVLDGRLQSLCGKGRRK